MDQEQIRQWWWRRQGLDGSLRRKSPAEVLDQSGWARSVGGSCPYLTFSARAGVSREEADAAVKETAIHELPAARGCTYVVPASDFALALKVGEANVEADLRTVRKLGVPDAELTVLREEIIRALEGGPLDPDGIRERVGGAIRDLGPDGIKKGLASTLPVALAQLQSGGEIRRISVNGRLDTQRFRYALWHPNPLSGGSIGPEEAAAELARRYFRWIGPAAVLEFQWFSGLGAKAAKSAVAELNVLPVGPGDDRMMFPEDREDLLTMKKSRDPEYALVSSLDASILLRRDIKGLLDDADLNRVVFTGKDSSSVGALSDLPSNAIFDRGRLIGLWEYEQESQSIAWTSFVPRNRDLETAVSTTEEYIRRQLGEVRSYSLDTPKNRAPKIAALRTAALAQTQ